MSMPLCNAFTPFALEMIIGRFPAGAGSETPSDAGAAPKSLGVPATAVPAREVRKNLRRDHRLMGASLNLARPIYRRQRPVASGEGSACRNPLALVCTPGVQQKSAQGIEKA